jgi:hypothetical protein
VTRLGKHRVGQRRERIGNEDLLGEADGEERDTADDAPSRNRWMISLCRTSGPARIWGKGAI